MHDHDVMITLVDAQHHEQRYEFEEPQLCIVGRAYDCDITAPESVENLAVSRHHCLLEIDPPIVRVHDLGSTNGTYVNGVKIPRGRAKRTQREGIQLFDGDEVVLGPIVLRVLVPVRAQDAACTDFALEFDDPILWQPVGDATGSTVDGRKTKCR